MSERKRGACLVCGENLTYYPKAVEMECVFCGKTELSHASCEKGHYVCDACHAKKGIEVIMEICQKTDSKNPVEIARKIMEDPYIYMHGPEHHVMVGAVLLTAYRNSGGDIDLKEALEEMKERGSQIPGGRVRLLGVLRSRSQHRDLYEYCNGSYASCGTLLGAGKPDNGQALEAIGELGGPRCCKRDTFTAIRKAAEMTAKELGVEMDCPAEIVCTFSEENQQCLKKACPYHG